MAKKVGKDKSKLELDTVSVFCRLKPLQENNLSCIKLISPTVVSLTCLNESKVVRKDAHYTFKHIFTSFASQQEIFDRVAYPLLEDLLNGKNGLLFTYGVTGSGKTYTLTGNHYNPGIMPRCIDTIFNSIESNQLPKYMIKSDKMNGFDVQNAIDAKADSLLENKHNKKTKKKGDKLLYTNDSSTVIEINETSLYTVFVTYIEIYNNTVYDLLDEAGSKVLQSKMLREDSQKNMYVNGVVEVEVKSASEAYELFNVGLKRKRMGHTLLNAESSRSHSIFNLKVVQMENARNVSNTNVLLTDENCLKVGQLSLVDLAGSERCNRTQTTGMRLKEASAINNSLMSLRNCLDILRENQVNNSNKLIPYRESRLTHIFKNYFEGGGKVEMIVCANPAVSDFEENMHVMKFAEITQDVKVIKPESRYTPYRKTCKVKEAPDTPVNKVKGFAKIPYIKLDSENIDDSITSIQNLTKILMSRKRNSLVHNRELNMREKQLRNNICSLNQANNSNLIELKSVQQQFNKMKGKCQRLETKAQELQMLNEALQCKKESSVDIFKTPPSQRKETIWNRKPLDSQRPKILSVKQENSNPEFTKKTKTNEKVKRVREMLANSDINVLRAKQKFESLFTESTNKLFTPKQQSNRKQMRRSRSVDVLRRQNSVDSSE